MPFAPKMQIVFVKHLAITVPMELALRLAEVAARMTRSALACSPVAVIAVHQRLASLVFAGLPARLATTRDATGPLVALIAMPRAPPARLGSRAMRSAPSTPTATRRATAGCVPTTTTVCRRPSTRRKPRWEAPTSTTSRPTEGTFFFSLFLFCALEGSSCSACQILVVDHYMLNTSAYHL